MKVLHTSIVFLLICTSMIFQPVSAVGYDASLSISLILPVLLPNQELGLEIYETVYGYFSHTAAFQNGTLLEKFDDIGINTSLIVGNESARLSSFQLGLDDMGYEFQLSEFSFPKLESRFEFHMFNNSKETVIPVATLHFPDDVSDQVECIRTEQDICEDFYALNVVNSIWNVTFTGRVSIVSTAIFEQEDGSSSVFAIIFWSAFILVMIFVLIRFLSK